MTEELLTILKFCLIALLYLFFFRVLRTVWVEMNPPPALERAPGGAASVGPGPTPNVSKRQAKKIPSQMTVTEPPQLRGQTYPLSSELTLGRAAGCNVSMPGDTFASSIHARVYGRDGQIWVEDLGSTNGTFVNRARITTATAVQRGDQLQVGNTVLELQ